VGRSVLILLDTHVVIWLASDDPRLSKNAKAAIDEARQGQQGLAVSDFTLFELLMVFRKKRIGISISLESFLFEVEQRFVVLPITRDVCVQTLAFPANYPNDPADRIIGATAVVYGRKLVTADRAIRESRAIPTIW
jgi:PIN domain nuclease of toxin-antitoxin system